MSGEKEFIQEKLGRQLAGELSGKSLSEIKSIINSMAGKDRALYKIVAAMTMSGYGRKILSSSPKGKKKLFLFNGLSFLNLMLFAGFFIMLLMRLWWAAAGAAAIYFLVTNPFQTGLGYDMAARMIYEADKIEEQNPGPGARVKGGDD